MCIRPQNVYSNVFYTLCRCWVIAPKNVKINLTVNVDISKPEGCAASYQQVRSIPNPPIVHIFCIHPMFSRSNFPAFTNSLNRTWRAVCKCTLSTSSQTVQNIWQYNKMKLVEQSGRSFWPDHSRVKSHVEKYGKGPWTQHATSYQPVDVVKCSGTFSKFSKCFLTSMDSDQLTFIIR